MGADSKRKEARKRKFGGYNSDSRPDTGAHSDLEGTSTGLDSMKAKQIPPPLSSGASLPAERIAARNYEVIDDSTNQERAGSAVYKSKRFILFIGTSKVSRHPWLGHLTARNQEICLLLQRMSQFESTLRKLIHYQSGIGRKRTQGSLKALHFWSLRSMIE